MPRAILLPALLSSAVHAASLSPCGSRAIFEITEDGGTNFAAVVRVPRWQEGAKVQLVWGANAVSVRDESVSKSVKHEGALAAPPAPINLQPCLAW